MRHTVRWTENGRQQTAEFDRAGDARRAVLELTRRGNKDAEILSEHEQPSPVDRPGGFVIKAPGQGYFVRSRTQAGVWWFVNETDCSCPAQGPCWHVQRTYAFETALTTPRPSAPPNIQALVD